MEINLGPKPNPCHSFSIFYWAYILDVNWVTYLRGRMHRGGGVLTGFYGMLLLRNLTLYVYHKPISIRLTLFMMAILIFESIT